MGREQAAGNSHRRGRGRRGRPRVAARRGAGISPHAQSRQPPSPQPSPSDGEGAGGGHSHRRGCGRRGRPRVAARASPYARAGGHMGPPLRGEGGDGRLAAGISPRHGYIVNIRYACLLASCPSSCYNICAQSSCNRRSCRQVDRHRVAFGVEGATVTLTLTFGAASFLFLWPTSIHCPPVSPRLSRARRSARWAFCCVPH